MLLNIIFQNQTQELCLGYSKLFCRNNSPQYLFSVEYSPAKERIFGVCRSGKDNGTCTEVDSFHNKTVQKYRHEDIKLFCAKSITTGPLTTPMIAVNGSNLKLLTTNYRTNYSDQTIFYKDKLELEDTGSYRCLGNEIILQVLDTQPPKKNKARNDMNGNQLHINQIQGSKDNKISMDCSVTGTPEPNITWYKDDVPILDIRNLSSSISNGGTVLTIFWHAAEDTNGNETQQSLTRQVTGTYKCDASNIAGTYVGLKYIAEDCHIVECLWVDPSGRKLLIGVTLTTTILMILLLTVLFMCRRQKLAKEEISAREIACFLHGNPGEYNESLPVEEQVCLLPYDEDIEFPKERLTLCQQIGSGAFGKVVSTILNTNYG